jgi:uncharacterized membrane protein YedE/YeeE
LGASGNLGGLIDDPTSAAAGERALFLAGLVGFPGLLAVLIGAPESHPATGIVPFVLAGCLVGIDARVANGCTTGHGVCGLARLGTRSILAIGCFIGSGVCTVLVLRLLGS